MRLVDSSGNATLPETPASKPLPEIAAVHTAKPRGGFVTIRLCPRPTEKKKGGIYLPTESVGDMFEQGIIVDVGRGILTDSGKYGGTDDLTPGMRVLVKTGQRVPARGALGSTVFQEMKGVITLEVEGEESLILANHQDVYAILN